MRHQAGQQLASRHHTVDDQIHAVCRLLAHQIDGFLEELDECPATADLRMLADDLRVAGGGISGSRVLRLVPPAG